MQNSLKLGILALCFFAMHLGHSQSLVLGGFTSFNLSTDSSQISSNSGGVLVVNDKLFSCVQIQSGNSIGGFELYSQLGVYNDACLQISPTEKISKLMVYPNPGVGQYNLVATDAVGFYITDITGKTVFPYLNVDQNELVHPFDISGLAEACYIVFVTLNDGKIKSLPIIKTIK